VENDRIAVEAALENLQRNQSERIDLQHRNIDEFEAPPAQLILGNLTYLAYKNIGQHIWKLLATSGCLIASGILREDAEKFHSLFPQANFVEERMRGEWWAGVLQK